MAKSVTKNTVRSQGIKQFKVPFEFTTANTSAPTGVQGLGVASVAYNSATGRFLITLRDTYRRLSAFHAEPIGTTVYRCQLRAVNNEATASVITLEVVVLNTSLAAADTTGVRIVGEATFEDSDAG